MKNQIFFLTLVLMSFIQFMNAQVPTYVPTNGLVGYWGFNGNANDTSGNGNNGTVTGATLTTDRFGNINSAYSFDGSSSYIAVPHNAAFSMQKGTWNVWVKSNVATTGNGRFIMGKRDNASHFVSFYERNGNGGEQIGWAPNLANGTLGYSINNNWHLLTITYDLTLTTNNHSFYFDGVLVASGGWPSSFIFNNGDLRFGIEANSSYFQPFNGLIDDASIYNRILSQTEIQQLYTGTVAVASCPTLSGTLTNGLMAYYPFCGNANDASGNNNNGTVNGATLTTDRFGNANSAYSFNGTSNFISCSNAPLINVPFTISAWVNLNTLSGFSPILSLGDLGANNLKKFYFSPVYGGIGKPSIGTGGANDITSTSTVVTPSNWIHVAVCVTSYSSTNVVFYVNGVSYNVNTTGGGNIPFPLNNSGFVIGKDAGTGGYSYFKGKIDDLSIYNRILTDQEIAALYGQNICYQSITVTDTLIINTGILSYNPITYNNTITIYPNPAKDHITIDCGTLTNVAGYSIKIVNTLGQEVFNKPLNTQQYYVPLNSWTGQGIYFVNIIDPQGHTIDIRKIILQ